MMKANPSLCVNCHIGTCVQVQTLQFSFQDLMVNECRGLTSGTVLMHKSLHDSDEQNNPIGTLCAHFSSSSILANDRASVRGLFSLLPIIAFKELSCQY